MTSRTGTRPSTRRIHERASLGALATITATLVFIAPASPAAAVEVIGSGAGTFQEIPDGATSSIPSPGAPLDVTFNVTGVVAPITDVQVRVFMSHPWAGDVDVSLIAPDGASHTIFSRTRASTAGGAGDGSRLSGPYDFSDSALDAPTWWDAAAGTPAATAVPAGYYRSSMPGGAGSTGSNTLITPAFAAVGNPNGVWTLRFLDVTGGSTGYVTSASLTVTGTTAPASTLSVSPLSKAFGTQDTGTDSAFQLFTVTNTGTANVSVATAGLTGTDPGQFDQGTDTCTGTSLAPAATCAVQVRFSPTTTGAKTAQLRFTHDATGSPSDVMLSGTGAVPATNPSFATDPTASITGTARIGWTLYAKAGSPSPSPTSLAYRWYANGTKLSATTRTLKLTSAHHGKRIQVRIYAVKPGFLTASNLSPATAKISNLQAKTISMELNDYTVKRGQRIYAEIELLASGEPWSIVLDGKKLASGVANTKGIAVTGLTIPTNATTGKRILRAYGKFTDRTDPDRITIR